MTNIAKYIDHTILKPGTTYIEIKQICEEAMEFGFAAVCIPPPCVTLAGAILKSGAVKVATVVGFPFGYSVIKAKLAEVDQALLDGADELDIVVNGLALKNGEWTYLKEEMETLSNRIHIAGRVVKVIIESGMLTEDEIVRCCEIYGQIGVDFLKTSTGYAEKGATVEAVRLMRRHLPPKIRIKASGGIRSYDQAILFIEAGADRLGCSAGVAIVKGETVADGY